MNDTDAPPALDHYCPTCHRSVPRFKPGGVRSRPNAKCPSCGALERHRFLALLLDGLAPTLAHVATVVDIAPSRYTTDHLERFTPERYIRVDLDPAADGRAVDVQASLIGLPFADASVDLVICYHVLEHVPDDATAMRELARVLTPGGLALVQVPFRPTKVTDEDPDASEEERIERFGQADHVRWYGGDFEDRLAAAGLRGIRIQPRDVLGETVPSFFGITPKESIWLLRPAGDQPATVGRAQAPANELLIGLHAMAVSAASARLAALEHDNAALRDDVVRLRGERDRVKAQRDRWRARHEQLTGHPVARALAAPYRWVKRS